MSYQKNLFIKVIIPLAIFITSFFLFGGRMYQEYFIRNFTPEWKNFARSRCHYFTVIGPIYGKLLGYCNLEAMEKYNNTGAVPVEGEKCPQGFIMTRPSLLVGYIPACYPEDAKEVAPKPQVEFYQSDDFDTSKIGIPYQ